jgi:hypothetical protein
MIKKFLNKIWEPKRSYAQREEAITKQDYTGGYTKILPWVWYMRKGVAFAALFNLLLGLKVVSIYAIDKSPAALITGLVFTFAVPGLIIGLLNREFKEKKKGIVR